jgi:hypothetical protein
MRSSQLEVQVASYDGALNAPIVLNDTTFLIPGLGYHVDSVSFQVTPAEFIELGAFHSAELAVLGVKLLPKNWALSVRLAAGLAGDFAAIDLKMLRFGAVAMATKAFGDRLVLAFPPSISIGHQDHGYSLRHSSPHSRSSRLKREPVSNSV